MIKASDLPAARSSAGAQTASADAAQAQTTAVQNAEATADSAQASVYPSRNLVLENGRYHVAKREK
jgi:hypothetical protein